MKRIRDQVGGLDVHRDSVVACARVIEIDRSVSVTKVSFATTSKGLGELAGWLSDAGVTTVAMEATGVYWKPVYYVLEGLFNELWLCNSGRSGRIGSRLRVGTARAVLRVSRRAAAALRLRRSASGPIALCPDRRGAATAC